MILFFCETTDQRPYRVVEVDADRFSSQDDVERLSSKELQELYRRSSSLLVPTLRSDEVEDVLKKASE